MRERSLPSFTKNKVGSLSDDTTCVRIWRLVHNNNKIEKNNQRNGCELQYKSDWAERGKIGW